MQDLEISSVEEILKSESKEQEKTKYVEGQINWLDSPFWDSWDKLKGHFKKLNNHKREFDESEKTKWCFLSHFKDSIRGKPQLVDNVKRKIPLIRKTVKTLKKGDDGKKLDMPLDIVSYFFFDEKFDARYDGYQAECFSLDFWLYRVIDKGKEFYLYSQEKLPSENCVLSGMTVELSDTTELSRSLKISSISRIFFVRSFEPDVKIMTKKEMVDLSKGYNITEKDWYDFLEYHPLGNYNRFPKESRNLKSSFVLSGKKDGYPLSLMAIGRPGTKKTMGIIDTLHNRFKEEQNVCAGSMSTLKGLIPSFQKSPPDIGYIAKAHRLACIDELGKLIERELYKHDGNSQNNVMGYLNDLLEHKERLAGSGSDGVSIKATAKCLFVTNPLSNRPTIHSMVGVIDNTTLSRMLVWVQDDQETKFCLSEQSIESPPIVPQDYQIPQEIPPIPTQEYILLLEKERKNGLVLGKYRGEVLERYFLSLFDTCYSFTCQISEEEVKRLVKSTSTIAKEPMKSSVWLPRAPHHIYLLVDGIVKTRCLFRDYDPTFTPIEEDYILAERILIRMVRSWDTDLSPKKDETRK